MAKHRLKTVVGVFPGVAAGSAWKRLYPAARAHVIIRTPAQLLNERTLQPQLTYDVAYVARVCERWIDRIDVIVPVVHWLDEWEVSE